MIKLDGIEIQGFTIHSDEFIKDWDNRIRKLEAKLAKQEELLKVADEVIKYSRQLILYSTHGEIVADYQLAKEKYEALKSKT